MALISQEDIERISPFFNTRAGRRLIGFGMRISGIKDVSDLYERNEHLKGPAFADGCLKDLDLKYEVAGMEHLQGLEDKPFITISNHPYGGLDGLIIIDLIGHFREDYKVMANSILSLVKTLEDNFISVIPHNKASEGIANESIAGIRMALAHVRDGHPLGLFPAGAVSDYSFRDRCVRDRQWQDSAIRLIRRMKVPVVPIHFLDRNSNLFYFLGLINWKLRMMRMPREVINKKGKTVHLAIGPVIDVETQEACPEDQFASMLRNSVYGAVAV